MNDSNAFNMDFDGSTHLAFNRPERPLPGPNEIATYAAGPLTNNDEDVERDCVEVRNILKHVLGSYDFQGTRFRVYDPGDVTKPGSLHTSDEVYELNYEQCVVADLVLFHVNVPSLGVGCESQISADATAPRVTIAKHGVPVSRMFDGIFSTTIATIEYDNYADFELQLLNLLPTIAQRTVDSARRRRPLLSEFSALQLGSIIFKQRIVHNVGIDQLAQRTDIKESWLRRLERNPVLSACCTAIQLNRIASITNCYVKSVDTRNLTTLVPSDDQLSNDQRSSLGNLASYIYSKDRWVPDERVFRLWNEYRDESQNEAEEAIEFREGEQQIISIDDWRRRDQQHPRLF